MAKLQVKKGQRPKAVIARNRKAAKAARIKLQALEIDRCNREWAQVYNRFITIEAMIQYHAVTIQSIEKINQHLEKWNLAYFRSLLDEVILLHYDTVDEIRVFDTVAEFTKIINRGREYVNMLSQEVPVVIKGIYDELYAFVASYVDSDSPAYELNYRFPSSIVTSRVVYFNKRALCRWHNIANSSVSKVVVDNQNVGVQLLPGKTLRKVSVQEFIKYVDGLQTLCGVD